jgi:hypothetical protein
LPADTAALGFLSDVGKMTETTNRNSANLRIYCDQDRRWKPRIDYASKQPIGGFEDPDNWLLYAEGLGPQGGCLDLDKNGEKYTLAQTYNEYMPGFELMKPQEAMRAAITVSLCRDLCISLNSKLNI